MSALAQLDGSNTENATSKYVWTLEESINYALEHNITIQQADLDLESANLNYEQSKMNRLPNLSANVSQRLASGNSIDPITYDFINQKSSATSVNLNSSLTLFNGFKNTNSIKQNELVSQYTELLLEETKNSIQVSVMEAYIQAFFSKEAVVIAQNQLEASTKELEQAEGLYNGRSLTLKDLNDVQAQHAQNQYNLLNAQVDYEQRVLSLKQLLELDATVDLELVAPEKDFSTTWLEDQQHIYQAALEFLPEVQASLSNIEINETNLDIAKGDLYPSLSLTAGLSSGYTNSQALNFSDQLEGNFSKSLGLSLSIPIFNRFSTSTNIQQAKINIKQAELNYEATQKELYRNIESARLSAISYAEQMQSAETARDAARSSYDLAQAQFNVGELTATNLIVAQTAFNTAELNYLQAKYLTILYTQLIEFYQGNPITL
ncbi:MAG: TolC family protein [Balneola sp.]